MKKKKPTKVKRVKGFAIVRYSPWVGTFYGAYSNKTTAQSHCFKGATVVPAEIVFLLPTP